MSKGGRYNASVFRFQCCLVRLSDTHSRFANCDRRSLLARLVTAVLTVGLVSCARLARQTGECSQSEYHQSKFDDRIHFLCAGFR